MKRNLRPWQGSQPTLGDRIWVDPDASVIGRVELADDVSIWPGAVLRGDVNVIRVGARTNIQDGTICHVTHDGPYTPGGLPLELGADITVGHGAILHACSIGDRCLIGMGALVLDGAEIAEDVMLAAGSLVSPGKQLSAGWLYRGRPAEPVRELSERELEMLRYSAEHYVHLKDRYLKEGENA
ncbi:MULTISPECIES: gamma carbonic anhydrase family protein [unclassified Wenzhouxiangella]|uniref:gamma carbonic anhydrase family protein n=1 Tax=unclassified Wenzhouxiangella TaxID=2613841 RepID=UPI000E329CAC|nr:MULTISPECIES: gamma carbonic anhydrase family protein [unclassified Wenzhouxiangella]RFF27396.1 gamma carbonic anhydrase family protein [Wenzhouxiangella sp. 15181]RFP68824.1 gamma carbonic anhydrase family protein [Wenzhouxiangella sp. 15190]